jgi:hypothetical protein
MKPSEKRRLLLKCATKEPLLEKTVDAHSSDAAVDKDDPVRMTVGDKCLRAEGAYAMG